MLKPEKNLSISLNPNMSQIIVNLAYQEGQSHVGWATSFCCPPLFNEEGGQEKDFAHPT